MEFENMNNNGNEGTMATAQKAVEAIEAAVERPGVDVGKILLGAGGVTLVTFATVKLVQWGIKAYKKHEENKKLRKPEAGQVVEPTEEQIEEVTVTK